MNLSKAIQKLSSKYSDSYQKLSVIISNSNDIDGGLNFKQTKRYIKIEKGKWIVRKIQEKIVQPEFGKTIADVLNSSKDEYNDREFRSYLTSDRITIDELRQVVNKITNEINLKD